MKIVYLLAGYMQKLVTLRMSTQESIFCKNCVLKEMINVQYIKLGLHFLSYFFLMDMFLYSLPWGQASESDGKESLPAMCQAVCIAQP